MKPHLYHFLHLICLTGSIAQDLTLHTTVQPATTISPVCIEPRATSDPSALDIVTALNNTDAVANACDAALDQADNDGTFTTI